VLVSFAVSMASNQMILSIKLLISFSFFLFKIINFGLITYIKKKKSIFANHYEFIH